MNLIRFKALLHREIIRFSKVMNQTILSPVISSFLYLAVFGFILGKHVTMVENVNYIQFIIPGIIITEIIMSSYSNTSSSLFLSRYLHVLDSLLVTPVTYTEMVLANITAGVLRGILVGMLIWGTSILFSPITLVHPVYFVFFMVMTCLVFSAIGLIVALWSEEFEDLSIITTYFITPLTFLGGVFYSLKMLSPIMYHITIWNPFFYLIDAFRWTMIGYSEGNLVISAVLSVALAILFILVNVYLFKKGYKIKQ